MKKYLGLSTILATSVLLTACSDDKPAAPSKPVAENTTITSSTNSPDSSSKSSTNSNSESQVSETTASQAGTKQEANTTTTKAPAAETTTKATTAATKATVSSKINVGAIAGGNLASVVGTYPAINGGTFTIKDSKTIVYNASGEEKILTITGYGQQEGAAVINAVFSSINGKPIDASIPSPGGNGGAFYFVPAGQKSPAGFVIGSDDISRDRVVTLNNAFYLN